MKTALKSIAITVIAGAILIGLYEGYQAMKNKKAEDKRKAAETPANPSTPPATK